MKKQDFAGRIYIVFYLRDRRLKTHTHKPKQSYRLTLQLPWVTKRELLLTISVQYQVEKWWE